MDKENIIKNLKVILDKYNNSEHVMPEDTNPHLKKGSELNLVYYTLPMALNYQRNSYKLWEAALKTFNDGATKEVFNLEFCANSEEEKLRKHLIKYKLALQPNNHIKIWKTITKTIFENWKTLSNLFVQVDNDFLKLREVIQGEYKKGFPYLSGPKIFNYWSYIMESYGGIRLKNREYIEIAPDTHVIQASIKLEVISKEQASKISREELSQIWRQLLKGTSMSPIDVHSPLWFWDKGLI